MSRDVLAPPRTTPHNTTAIPAIPLLKLPKLREHRNILRAIDCRIFGQSIDDCGAAEAGSVIWAVPSSQPCKVNWISRITD